MAIAIETYEDKEIAEQTSEETEAALALATELGLEAQITALTPRSASATGANLYPQMSTEQQFVFRETCPDRVKLENFTQPLPLRVMQIVAHVRQQQFFQKLEVWHCQGHPDPVLVGFKSDSYSAPPHALARWGDELESWPTLVKRAMARFKARIQNEIEAARAKLDSIEAQAKRMQSPPNSANPSVTCYSSGF